MASYRNVVSLTAHLLLLSIMASQANSGSFFRLQQKLIQQTRDETLNNDLMVSDVEQWVSKTIDRFSHQVEFLGNEIERAVNQQTFLEHDKFFSDGAMDNMGMSELQRETPPYQLLCSSADGYEARQYYKALWIITFSEPGEDYLSSKVRCHTKIKEYILGNNEREVKIHITSPWLSQVIRSSETGDEMEQYAFIFFLPSTYQDDPPSPIDPTIFFQYMSPRVFAFSFGYGVGHEAGRYLHQEVTQLLVQNDETFIASQYYISDYEVPFSENSKNNEMFIPLNESQLNKPHCGAIPQPPPPHYEQNSIDLDNDDNSNVLPTEGVDNVQVTELFHPRAESKQSALYLHTEVTGSSPDAVDAAIIELILNIRMSFSEDILNENPWDILLRVSCSPDGQIAATTCLDSRHIELFFKVPPTFQELSLPESLTNNNTSLCTLPASMNYVQTFDMSDADATLLGSAFTAHSKLKQKIQDASLCYRDTTFYVYSNLQSASTDVNQVWIPYSNDCWNEDETKPNHSSSLSASSLLSDGGEAADYSGDDDFSTSYVHHQ